MPVEEELYTRLTGFTDLTDLLSTTTSVYFVKKDGDQPGYPFVTYEFAATIQAHHTMSLPAAFDTTDQLRVHVWAKTSIVCRNVAAQVREALHNYSATAIVACIFDTQADVLDPDEGIYHRVLDFDLTYTVSV